MANGIKFGRKRKLSDNQRAEVIKRCAAGETLAQIAKRYDPALEKRIRRICVAAKAYARSRVSAALALVRCSAFSRK